MSDHSIKKVKVTLENMELLEKLAEMHDRPANDLLSIFINKAIRREFNESNIKQPLYVWKS